MKKVFLGILVFVFFVGTVSANSIDSSTIFFEGTLTDDGDGSYSGTVDAVSGSYYIPGGPGTVWDPVDLRYETPDGREAVGGWDVYAEYGGDAYYDDLFQGVIGSDHDAYSSSGGWGAFWDPDVPDWDHYQLTFSGNNWYLEYKSIHLGTPMSGDVDWSDMYAYETDVGSYRGTVPADPDANDGDAALNGGGAQAWDMDWTWGSEAIPLEYPGFDLEIDYLYAGVYSVILTPASAPVSPPPPGSSSTIGGTVGVEDFPLKVWQCGDRILKDEDVQPWRYSRDSEMLMERNNNYLFEGETYQVDVLVMDKNKIDEVKVDVVFEGVNNLSLNCVPTGKQNFPNCNAMIDEESVDWDANLMEMYTCIIEVPDSSIAYGEYEVKVIASDYGGTAEYDETSVMFINPLISVDVSGLLDFSGVRPGTSEYSNVQVTNLAEGGVILDMFILGEDWDSTDPVQGRCNQGNGILLNQLPLSAFRYYVENGAYNSRGDRQIDMDNYDPAVVRNADAEGYLNIHRNLNGGFDEDMFAEAEILQENEIAVAGVPGGEIWAANWLYPGSTGMTLTFRLTLPEPCYGNYQNLDGFTIIGEAI